MSVARVNAESCNGATVHNGTNETIIDANNDTWTIISNNTIDKNMSPAGYSSGVVLLLYWNRTIYQMNNDGYWYQWIGGTSPWVATNDPRSSPNSTTTPGCTLTSSIGTILTTTELSTPNTDMSSTDSLVTTDGITAMKTPSVVFVAPICSNPTHIGIGCNISNKPCDILQPCQNAGSCINTNDTYICKCSLGFNGSECQFDYRPCKPFTCWNNGTCMEVTNTTFNCTCAFGWTGIHCETKINFCANVTCQNNGVCRPLLGDYKCECLGDSFSGRHCEITAAHIVLLRVISRSCAYIAISAGIIVVAFVVIMDILKYCFGIDPTRDELERIRRQKRAKKTKHPVIIRYTYVHAPPPVSISEQQTSIVKSTVV